MNDSHSLMDRLQPLLEAACEESLSPEAALRLEAELRDSAEARWLYLTYMELHGSLYWDAAGGLAPALPEPSAAPAEPISPAARRRSTAAIAATALALVLTAVVAPLWWGGQHTGPAKIADKDTPSVAPAPAFVDPNTAAPHRDPGAPAIAMHPATRPIPSNKDATTPVAAVSPAPSGVPATGTTTAIDPAMPGTSAKLIPVSLINSELAEGWHFAGIQPSAHHRRWRMAPPADPRYRRPDSHGRGARTVPRRSLGRPPRPCRRPPAGCPRVRPSSHHQMGQSPRRPFVRPGSRSARPEEIPPDRLRRQPPLERTGLRPRLRRRERPRQRRRQLPARPPQQPGPPRHGPHRPPVSRAAAPVRTVS